MAALSSKNSAGVPGVSAGQQLLAILVTCSCDLPSPVSDFKGKDPSLFSWLAWDGSREGTK